MTRYVIDAPTIVHLVDDQPSVDAEHRLVARAPTQVLLAGG
jgi:hypothetical protein